MLLFVGTYTRDTDSVGIYAFDVDASCTEFRQSAVNADIDNPSWLVLHPQLPVLYAVNEVSDVEGGGRVSAFAFDDSGTLVLMGRLSSMGADPCHLAIDRSGSFLLASNYSGGNLASFSIDEKGNLADLVSFVQHRGSSVDPVRQNAAHVHSVTLEASGRFAYVADLGVDRIYTYPLIGAHLGVNERTSVTLKPGTGPRHFCLDADGTHGFLINELNSSIVTLGVNDDGSLVELSTVSTLPAEENVANYCAHLQLSGDGRFLYATNRGHDSIAVFEVVRDGELEPVQFESTGGLHPRHFSLTQDGRYVIVANRDSDNLVVFERDEETGRLRATGTEISVPSPVCVLPA
jgi:6-phosphogluconolactonase